MISDLILKLNNEIKDPYNIDHEKVKNILKEYDDQDWKSYIYINEYTYNKSIVYENNLFEIYIITWDILQKSQIHDHPKNCFMKVLQGKLEEQKYDIDLKNTSITVLQKDDISFIDDKGYHKIKNIHDDVTVSLHVYSPIKHKAKIIF